MADTIDPRITEETIYRTPDGECFSTFEQAEAWVFRLDAEHYLRHFIQREVSASTLYQEQSAAKITSWFFDNYNITPR